MSTFQFFTSGFDSKLTVAVSEKYLQMMEKSFNIFWLNFNSAISTTR
jgi:hypothetical protein